MPFSRREGSQPASGSPSQGWKQPAARKKNLYARSYGCGCGLLLLLALAGTAAGLLVDAGRLSADNPIASPFALLPAALLVLLAVTLSIALGQRRGQKAGRPVYDPASAWDRALQSTIRKRRLGAGILLGLGILLFLLVAAAALWLVSRLAGGAGLEAPGTAGMLVPLLFLVLLLACGLLLLGLARLSGRGGGIDRERYRQTIVLPLLQAAFQEPCFHADAPFPTEGILGSGLLGGLGPNACLEGNDWLTAVYRGVAFVQADLHVAAPEGAAAGIPSKPARRRRGVTVPTRRTVFRGRWLSFNSRPLAGGLYLWSKNFPAAGRRLAAGRGMQPVALENTRFGQLFEVYAFSPHDAFLFLTPVLLERLAALAQTSCGQQAEQGVALVAVGDRVQVLVSGLEDAFEPGGLLWGNTEAESRAKTLREIAVVTDTLDAVLV